MDAARESGRVGVGVIGLGRIGTVHARHLACRVAGARLVAVADAVPERAAVIGAEYSVPAFDSLDALLDASGVEAVVVATPLATHAEAIARAADAGRHVLCEKPLAATSEEGRRAVAAAEAAGIRLQVGFHMRFDPDLAEVASRIGAGEIGDVVSVRATLRDMRPPGRVYLAGSGGLLLDGASHLLDLARWWGGEVAELATMAATRDEEVAAHGDHDLTVILARFESGAVAVLENARASGYGFECAAEVVGTRSTARVSAHRRRNVQWLTAGAVRTEHVADFVERFPEAYRAELEAFALAVREGRTATPSGQDAVAVTHLVECARRALGSRSTVAVPPVYAPDVA